MTDIDREIARNIILAQISSDAGKGIYELRLSDGSHKEATRRAYAVKEMYILRAVKLINRNRKCLFGYYIDTQREGFPVTYFSYPNGQISFHCPSASKELRTMKSGTRTHWVGKGKNFGSFNDSRKICKSLINEIQR